MPLPTLDRENSYSVVRQGNDARLFFSFSTLIAFTTPSGKMFARKNEWSATTGKHLNLADGGTPAARAARLDEADFEKAYVRSFGTLTAGVS